MESNQLYSIVKKGTGNIWEAEIKKDAQFYSTVKSLHQLAKENNKSIYFKFNGADRTMLPNYRLIEEVRKKSRLSNIVDKIKNVFE